MKTPFPAVCITRAAQQVTAVACTVTTLFPDAEQALIEITVRGVKVSKMVPYSSLASTSENATHKTAAAVAAFIAETFDTPAADEKSAVNDTAGAAAGGVILT